MGRGRRGSGREAPGQAREGQGLQPMGSPRLADAPSKGPGDARGLWRPSHCSSSPRTGARDPGEPCTGGEAGVQRFRREGKPEPLRRGHGAGPPLWGGNLGSRAERLLIWPNSPPTGLLSSQGTARTGPVRVRASHNRGPKEALGLSRPTGAPRATPAKPTVPSKPGALRRETVHRSAVFLTFNGCFKT